MDKLLRQLIELLRAGEIVSPDRLAQLIRSSNHDIRDVAQHHSKKKALLFYLNERKAQSELWKSWNVDERLDALVVRTLQVKPRRTASGVATITVVTKPAPCESNCLYCPNDIRMPKSYLTDEPACQRAERNYFDPYLQVVSRLRALTEMGHETDKVELIILGGSWSDYDPAYQVWFMRELFKALNDDEGAASVAAERRRFYQQCGLSQDPDQLHEQTCELQQRVNASELTYNEAFELFYTNSEPWRSVRSIQGCTIEELEREQRLNESARHRVVGLVVETRPDTVSVSSLTLLRRLGCTKVQIGVQSLDEAVIAANHRKTTGDDVAQAISLLRLFGFKIHTHFMLNLHASNPERDMAGYLEFVQNPAYRPDEVKLYPCVLVAGTGLEALYETGEWSPYADDELVQLLARMVLETPEYMRISRMIRDISAHDIKAGSKKTNLRQKVESAVAATGRPVREIRLREISTNDTEAVDLTMVESTYETAVSTEHFLQWVNDKNEIAGFLRLSLPSPAAVSRYGEGMPVAVGEAMIREVHVYGRAARLHGSTTGAQHKGLGKRLIERAFAIAKDAGYESINVISAVGTREYYRALGFEDAGLYLKARL